ncbi:hypothetical protein BC829DRAFT_404360 [Chytridium lagenaria]|nr:hypothetical protein BC829DRAFT_404360 [Chytridium lagenaria]
MVMVCLFFRWSLFWSPCLFFHVLFFLPSHICCSLLYPPMLSYHPGFGCVVVVVVVFVVVFN